MAFIFLVNLKTATNQFIRMKLIIFLIFINGLSLSISAPASNSIIFIKSKCPIIKDEEFFKQEAITKCSNINITLASTKKYLENTNITPQNSEELVCVLFFNNLFTFCEKINASVKLEPAELIPKGTNDFTICNSLVNITSLFHNNSHICQKYCTSEEGTFLPQCFSANYYAFYEIKVKSDTGKSDTGPESQVLNIQEAVDANVLDKDAKTQIKLDPEIGTNPKNGTAVAKNSATSTVNGNGISSTLEQTAKVVGPPVMVKNRNNADPANIPQPPDPREESVNALPKKPLSETEQPQGAPETSVQDLPKKLAEETQDIDQPPQHTSNQEAPVNGDNPKLPEHSQVVPDPKLAVPEPKEAVPEQQPAPPEQSPVIPDQPQDNADEHQDSMGANEMIDGKKDDFTDMDDEEPRQLEGDDDTNPEGEPGKDQMEIVKETKMEKPEKIEEDVAVSSSSMDDIDGESYFFSYFMVVCVLFVLGYIFYHNRTKVMALVLEGKRGKRQFRGRRPNSANYHKLDSNLEEAISSSCSKNSSNVIY